MNTCKELNSRHSPAQGQMPKKQNPAQWDRVSLQPPTKLDWETVALRNHTQCHWDG